MDERKENSVVVAEEKRISGFASLLRTAYKLSGAKKAFGLPEDEMKKVIEKQNRHRGVFNPTDRKAHYETVTVNGFPCLIVRENEKPSKRAILYFFGGGMVIGPDKGDLPVMRKLMRDTGCDVWFPFYPLCMEHCITDTYAMAYACYRRMIELYGGGNVSTCGFSSGGALALGIAAHNNAQAEPLPQPRHMTICRSCSVFCCYLGSYLSSKGKSRFYIYDFETLKNGFWIAKKPDKIGLFAGYIFFVPS